jgi:hypothetical protein
VLLLSALDAVHMYAMYTTVAADDADEARAMFSNQICCRSRTVP